jgi:carbamoyltransferase
LFAAGTNLAQVDKFVFNVYEPGMDRSLEKAYSDGSLTGFWLGRQFIQRLLEREFRYRVNPDRFEFIDHHYAHAASAFFPSSFPESLVVTFDGMGDGLSGSVWQGEERRLIHLRNYDGRVDAITQSLGFFYLAITTYLGFRFFDEYKVMGLVPYGDRNKFRSVFERFYSLKEKGDYDIFLSQLDVLQDICPKRGAGEPIETVHMDLAAATQECLETIAFHVLEFYKRETGASRLCLAGGVAQNCALNGKLLREKLFDEVFVQPASHDGGLSLGGALHGYCASDGKGSRKSCIIKHAYTGPSCGENLEIERELSRWSPWIEYERDSRIS